MSKNIVVAGHERTENSVAVVSVMKDGSNDTSWAFFDNSEEAKRIHSELEDSLEVTLYLTIEEYDNLSCNK